MVLTWQLLAHHGSYVGAGSISNAQTITGATNGTEVSISSIGIMKTHWIDDTEMQSALVEHLQFSLER